MGFFGWGKKKPSPGELHRAVRNDDVEEVRRLLDVGADVEARDEKGNTPLRHAVSVPLAELLLDSGADINSRNSEGLTPLHTAAHIVYPQLVKFYLQRGVEVDPVSDNGTTPLLTAGMFGNEAQMAMLLEAGANPNVENASGFKPWGKSPCGRGLSREILLLLKAHGAKLEAYYDPTPGETISIPRPARASQPALDAKRVAEAAYQELLCRRGGKKPKFDSEEVAAVLHPIAKRNNLPILFWQEAVERLQDMLEDADGCVLLPQATEEEAAALLLQGEPQRKPGKPDKPAEQRLPLIFALKHLHIRAPDPMLGALAAQPIRLMQGERKVPLAGDEQITAFLKQPCSGTLPEGTELELLRLSCQRWPEAALMAFAGITAFGAGNLDRARACAKHSLSLDPQGTLARQLVRLLSTTAEVRCPFGTDAAAAPDVPALLASETHDPLSPAQKPVPAPAPAPKENLIVACPRCSKKMSVPSNAVGKSVKCPSCNQLVRIPDAGGTPPAPVRKQPPALAPKECTECGWEPAMWDYAIGKQRIGPLSFAQLQQLAVADELQPSTMVYQHGTQKWASADSIPGLFSTRLSPTNPGMPSTLPRSGAESVKPSTAPLTALTVRCENPQCRSLLRIKGDLVGKRIKCPKCGQSLTISQSTCVVQKQQTLGSEAASARTIIANKECPECGAPMLDSESICILCRTRDLPAVECPGPNTVVADEQMMEESGMEESEQQLVEMLRRLCRRWAANEHNDEMVSSARAIGKEFDRRGGFAAMRSAFHALGGMRGSRTLEMWWEGIGGWRG
jgi:ankyrin repeat protein